MATLNQMVREFEAVLKQTAADQIAEVNRAAMELHDERDQDGHRRDLHLFEELFLSAVSETGKRHASYVGTAARMYGMNDEATEIVREASQKQMAKELQSAFATYRSAREDFYNGTIGAVAGAMEAAE